MMTGILRAPRFADAEDYWAKASSRPGIPHRIPTLLVNARTIPF